MLPALGESVTEGTVTRWLKQVGDSVAVDEPLVEVSTDKVDTEIPSPVAGVLLAITVGEDQTVDVGAELGVIGAAAGRPAPPAHLRQVASPAPAALRRPTAPPASTARRAALPPTPTAAPGATATISADVGYVTPLVRKLAAEYAVDLVDGDRHRRRRAHPQAGRPRRRQARRPAVDRSSRRASRLRRPVAPAVAPSPLRGRTEKMTRLRKVIAERLVDSLQNSAQLTTVIEVDVTRIALLRDRAKATSPSVRASSSASFPSSPRHRSRRSRCTRR